MTGFKTSRFGATETIMNDFLDVIFKGHALVCTRAIVQYKVVSWNQLCCGDEVMIMENDHLVSRHVESVTTVPIDPQYSLYTVTVVFVAGLRRVFVMQKDHVVNHLFESHCVREREMAFVHLSEYRTLAAAMGVTPWVHMIRYARPEALKQDYIKKRAAYGLFTGKELKLPYVNLIGKRTQLYEIFKNRAMAKSLCFPSEWIKQDPVIAFTRRYPVDLNMVTLLRDYFGTGFKCTVPEFDSKAALRKLPPGNGVHQSHVKSIIDTVFFNDNSKCLVHVLVDLHSERANYYNDTKAVTYDKMLKVVNKVTAVKHRYGELIKKGQEVFYTINGNVPCEMVPHEASYAYDINTDISIWPFNRRLDVTVTPERALVMYKEAKASFAAFKEQLSTLVHFVALDVPFTEKTLTVMPARLASELDTPPQLVIVSSSTEDPVLARCAQALYFATLAIHVLDGVAFQTHTAPMRSLSALPQKATPHDLKQYFIQLATYLEHNQPEAHCCGCLSFWMSQNPATIIARNYLFDGVFFNLIGGLQRCYALHFRR